MTSRSDAFAVTIDDSIDVREGEWDGARGEREIFDWATGADGEVDWRKAAKGFIVADLNPPEGENITRASFKLAVCYVENGKLVGIGNAIRNALARLSQTEGLSDAVQAEAKAKLEGMLARVKADVARSPEEQAQIREEFPALITMTPSQMRDWAASPFSGENRKQGDARTSARDALRRVIALKEKPMSDWTEGDYDAAVKAIAFVKRMSEVEQGDPIVIEGREGPSERDASLRDWGHWTDAAEHVDALAEPDEATAKAWVVEHLLDGRKMPRPRMSALKAIEDRYTWLKPPRVDVVFRGLRNLTVQTADKLQRPSDKVRDKSWTTSRSAADQYALAEHTTEDREKGKVGAVLEARANRDVLLFNAAELAATPGIGDVIHPDDGKPLRDMILAEQEVIALDSLDVVKVHTLSYEGLDTAAKLPTADQLTAELRGIADATPAKRAARGWTGRAPASALALLTALAPAQTDSASSRVYRTCTLDFAVDSAARVAIDRALQIADELGPRTDAAQINSIAERLRADGFADKVTADGRLIVTGFAARTGSQLYGDGKSTWYEYRSEDEVEKSLAGYANATFTDDHPPTLVTADNWREYARGHVGAGAELLPPDDEDGHRYVKVTICVGDIAVIRKMRDGKVELSAGYTTIAVRDPGVDAHGIRYTYRQTDIQINHLALVDQGRAGPRARVYIDGQVAVFEIKDHDDMTTKRSDQMTPEAAMALLDAIKAYAYADSPESAAAAIQTIAMALELDPEMVKQHLGGGEMMEMDGIRLMLSKDAATKIREVIAKVRGEQSKAHGDAAKLTNDLAAAQGKITALERSVAKMEADKMEADKRDLEREIAPLCPQLVSTWAAGKRPDSLTAMRAAAIVDLDSAMKAELDAAAGPDPANPAPTFDSFVGSLYRTTIRHAVARKPTSDSQALPSFASVTKIDTSTIYGKQA